MKTLFTLSRLTILKKHTNIKH